MSRTAFVYLSADSIRIWLLDLDERINNVESRNYGVVSFSFDILFAYLPQEHDAIICKTIIVTFLLDN